jgi:hypothetical protein
LVFVVDASGGGDGSSLSREIVIIRHYDFGAEREFDRNIDPHRNRGRFGCCRKAERPSTVLPRWRHRVKQQGIRADGRSVAVDPGRIA